ncbi:MAG: excisionase family DNA-binding protein [Capsulimonadaceae bacterium]
MTQPRTDSLSESAIRLAEQSSVALERLIAGLDNSDAPHRVTVESAGGARADLSVPEATLPLLLIVLRELGHGRGVAVIATDTELTTGQAADILQVSRPYFVKLLMEGRIPFRTVGSRRRVRLADILQYKGNEMATRHSGLDELVDEAQKLGMY